MKQIKIQKIGRLPLLSNKKPKGLLPKDKKSFFKAQLVERQKFRKNFLLTKKQLRTFLSPKSGQVKTLTMIEATKALACRLDFFIYTVCTSNNIFCTLREIRQKIRHGFIFVNDSREKRPNYLCQPTDQIRGFLPTRQNEQQPAPYAIHYQNLTNYFEKF